jgi:hypothetical protein
MQDSRRVDVALDPIQLGIFSHRFMSIAEQMGRALQRTSISTNIKERLDFSCALFGMVIGSDLLGCTAKQKVTSRFFWKKNSNMWLTSSLNFNQRIEWLFVQSTISKQAFRLARTSAIHWHLPPTRFRVSVIVKG